MGVGRARGFGRGQAELLAVMAMALVLAVLVAAVVRFAVLYQQARSGLEEKAREVYRVVLSGGVRGYVDTSTSTVYMSAGVPLVVYAVYIHNGTYVMWGSQVPPPYPSYATSQTAALSLSDYYTAVYRGSLARQVSNCSAWVVLVTDKGVFKWCPTCITLYATSLAVESPANPLGKFKAYYAGNLTYFALFGELTGDYYAYVEASRTTLYPLVLFYQDPVAVVGERWSGYVVNVTLRNPVTGDVAWLAFNASSGQVVGRGGGKIGANTYYAVLTAPQAGLSAATTVRPLSLGGVDVLAFTVYYLPDPIYESKGYLRASELFTSTTLSTTTTRYLLRERVGYYGTIMVCSLGFYNYVDEFRVSSQNWGEVLVGVVYPSTQTGTFAVLRQLDVATSNRLQYVSRDSYYHVEFKTTGNSTVPFSYTYQVSTMPSPASDTSKTSWSDCRSGDPTAVWFYLRASAGVRLPSGKVAPIGQSIALQVASAPPATPPPPSTPTATPTPFRLSEWTVRVEPKPESTTPTTVRVTLYTTNIVSPSDYSITYTIRDLDNNTTTTATVTPQPLYEGARFLGYGYRWELAGGSRKVISAVVRYKGEEYMSFVRYNYAT